MLAEQSEHDGEAAQHGEHRDAEALCPAKTAQLIAMEQMACACEWDIDRKV